MAREDTFQHLKLFDDVVSLITSNYVEEVNIDKVMHGAMHGLADGLDPDSAYLTADEVKQVESGAALASGDVGLELTRQVLPARHRRPRQFAGGESRPAHAATTCAPSTTSPRARCRCGKACARLRGAPGSKVTLDGHPRQRRRSARRRVDARGHAGLRSARPHRRQRLWGTCASRPSGPTRPALVKTQVAELVKSGATKLVIDVRRTSNGSVDQGIALARLFVKTGTLAVRETTGNVRDTIAAAAGDGAITLPAVVLIDAGTSGAAEMFASAMSGNQRADLVGEHTIGRAAVQRLVKLPDGSGLWLSTARYLTPGGTPLHEKGLEPTRDRRCPRGCRVRPATPGRRSDPRQGDRAARRKKSRVARVAASPNYPIARLPNHPILLVYCLFV